MHYYLQKSNYKLDELLALNTVDRMFLSASMQIEIEDEVERRNRNPFA